MRKSRARTKGGKTDWYVVCPAGQTFRSQKQLDAFTWRKGLHRIALKPQGLKQADKKRPAEEEERLEEDDEENPDIQKMKLNGERKIVKRRKHFKTGVDSAEVNEVPSDQTSKKGDEKVVRQIDVEGGEASDKETMIKYIMAAFTVLGRPGGGGAGGRKRRIAEEIMEELEGSSQALATVAVTFVSDGWELEERVEELGRSRSASRVRRNMLLVEDRMGRRTGRVIRIKEPMYWLKPSKTEVAI